MAGEMLKSTLLKSTCTLPGQGSKIYGRKLVRKCELSSIFQSSEQPCSELLNRLAIEEDPLRVFSYAVWANEVYTRDKAALATVHLEAEDIIYSLSRYYTVFTKWHSTFVAWVSPTLHTRFIELISNIIQVKFRDHIYDTFTEALRNPDPQMRQEHISGDCPRWNEFYCKLLVKLMSDRPCLEAFDDAVDEYRYIIDDCESCNKGVERWRVLLAAAMTGSSTSFSSFVKSTNNRD